MEKLYTSSHIPSFVFFFVLTSDWLFTGLAVIALGRKTEMSG